MKTLVRVLILLLLCGFASAQTPATLNAELGANFTFVAYGDIRFMHPSNTRDSDPVRRKMLVQKIAGEQPSILLISGDIVAHGSDTSQWSVFDLETAPFRDSAVKIYPALGNHDLRGDQTVALNNYFQRFPYLQKNRFYSVRAGNIMIFTIDSSLDHPGGEEMQWFDKQVDSLPDEVQFVVVQLHHPPLTRSNNSIFGGGHSPRGEEQDMAQFLESKAARSKARFIVVAGHVHNYERYERNGVMYIVTGGGGATPYMVPRQSNDAYRDSGATYHYCKFDVAAGKITMRMIKLNLNGNTPSWQERDSFEWSAK